MSLAHQAARGAAWTILTSLGARAIGVVGTIIMTHLLAPSVIGEVSAATIIAMTASWMTTWGFGSYAVVKGRGADAAEVTWHATVAYVSLGLVSLGAVALLAGHFAGFFDAPNAAKYIPGMAVAVFIRRLGAMPERVLIRSMRFRTIGMSVALGEAAYTLVSVVLATRGWGGEAIIVGNIVQSLLMTGLVMRAAGREWRTPTPLRRARFRDMLRFGLPLGLQGLAHSGSRYWDNLAISHIFGAGPTGVYNLAYNLADIPAVQVGEQLAQVLLPSMAALPPERRPRAFERSVALLSLLIFPLAVGLGVVAPSLIRVALNDEWQGVAPLLTVLAALSVFRPITWAIGPYLEAADRTGQLMFLEVAKLVLLIVGIFVLAPYGLIYSAGAVGVAFGLSALGGVAMVAKAGPRASVILISFMQPLLACGVMVGAVLGVRHGLRVAGVTMPIVYLLVEMAVGAIAYVASALVLCRATARDFISLAKSVVRRKRTRGADAADDAADDATP